jgi:hypothetical protein
MLSAEKNPKAKTNEEIEAYMRNAAAGTRPTKPCTAAMLERRLSHTKPFEFCTKFQDKEYIFQAMFLDGAGRKVLAASPNKAPARANAIASLIDDKCFPSVEAWVVACRNALGDNIDQFSLAGAIFVDGECVDDLLDALLNEPASPAEDKTDGKQLASPADDKPDDKEPASPAEDKTDDKEIAHAQVQLKYAQMFVQFFCEHQAKEQTVDA